MLSYTHCNLLNNQTHLRVRYSTVHFGAPGLKFTRLSRASTPTLPVNLSKPKPAIIRSHLTRPNRAVHRLHSSRFNNYRFQLPAALCFLCCESTTRRIPFCSCPVCCEGAAERDRLNSAIGDWRHGNRPLSSMSRGLLEQLAAVETSTPSLSPREQHTRGLGIGVDGPVVLEQPLFSLSAPPSSSGFASPGPSPSPGPGQQSAEQLDSDASLVRAPCDLDADGITFGVSPISSVTGACDEDGDEKQKQNQQQLMKIEARESTTGSGSGRTSAQTSSASLQRSSVGGSRGVVGAMASICSPGRLLHLKSRLRPKPVATLQSEALRWRRIVEDVGWLNMYIIPCRCKKAPEGGSPFAHLGDGYMDLAVVRKCSQWENLRFLYRIVSGGRAFDLSHVNTHRVREVRIRCLTRAERQQRMTRGGCFSTVELGSALQDLLHTTRNNLPPAALPRADNQRYADESIETAVEAEPDAGAAPLVPEAIVSSNPSSDTSLLLPRPPPPTPERGNTMVLSGKSSKRRNVAATSSIADADDVAHGVWNCDGEVLRATELSIVLHPQLIRFFGRGIEPLPRASSGGTAAGRGSAQTSVEHRGDASVKNAHRDESSASLPAGSAERLETLECPSPARNGRSNTRSVPQNMSVLGGSNGSPKKKKKRNFLQRLFLNLQPKHNKRLKHHLEQSASPSPLFLD